MSNNSIKRVAVFLSVIAISACTSTVANTQTPKASTVHQNYEIVKPVAPETGLMAQNDKIIALEKIMSDPDWIGRQPESAYWADDSQSVFYSRKRAGSVVRDLWTTGISSDNASQIDIADLHKVHYANRVLSKNQHFAAWLASNNLFVKDLQTGKIRQLTKGVAGIRNLVFIDDGRLSYQIGDALYATDLNSGFVEQLASWKFAEAKTANKPPKDYIAAEQQKLIGYIQTVRKQNEQRFDYQQQIVAQNETATRNPFYLSEGFKTVNVTLSPDGKKLIVVIAKDVPENDDTDVMPHHIQEDGRIDIKNVRRRVLDEKPIEYQVWYMDLSAGQAHPISFESLPGYNEDVLADVKRENASAQGKEYQVNRLPRSLAIMENWGDNVDSVAWNSKSDQVAIMLEAWDNKDRWLATVDFKKHKLISQHRLHDDAWINYHFNQFGWLNNSDALYYLSEESGYANLYIKPLNGKAYPLVSGQFEVDSLTLTSNDEYFYYSSNKPHPGMYEIYRVNIANKKSERLTHLLGNTSYELSPDEQKLLLTHSKITMPPELYIQPAQPSEQVTRITHTVSEEFLSMPWVMPEIVPVPSTHVDEPIYAKLYRPVSNSDEKRRAVIFNHGAGYLQNSHFGWSGYFREFMFHSMLAQQGYVVMDMDYRASAGYGRDWRTAIYRHMGKPEIEDLEDGVNWMVENANVDPKRVGTYGGSYGGFMTFMALFTKPELFQAGAALRPVSDWAHYNGPYTSNILNTPDVDPIAYERSSPIYFAEGLNKPMLINAPMVDDNVFFLDVVRLVQRLIELEKQDFETAIYPVEPHGFVQPSSWLDEYRRIYKLFEENL